MRGLGMPMLFASIVLLILIWGVHKIPLDEQALAERALTMRGYKLTNDAVTTDRYILDKSMLMVEEGNWPRIMVWGTQKVSPDAYLGTMIEEYHFVVTNHPLKRFSKTNTAVTVMLAEGRVIGGYAFPLPLSNGAIFMGGPSYLDGSDMEHITGLTYAEWLDQWTLKYGKAD
ncbi:hypothetical protein [Paenibacillus sp. ATY16]|uniref:hypothetical protein n=1 Tax=Paenibacillus sp. ATY16 TaxID=1759312 RepID=UPI00200DC4D9|nr:hypothetical protein [Paenibacillus sp. ATY16]